MKRPWGAIVVFHSPIVQNDIRFDVYTPGRDDKVSSIFPSTGKRIF